METVDNLRERVRDLHKEFEVGLWTDESPDTRSGIFLAMASLDLTHPLDGPCPWCDPDDLWR